MILNGMVHAESPSRPGFTGVTIRDRAAAAGYRVRGDAENCFRDAPDVWGCHVGFVVDFGEGTGGMQDRRPHRANMLNPAFREVGIGVLPHEDGLSVTQDFSGSRRRFVGGVVYVDADGDGFYDIGEGLGGVEISSSQGETAKTWSSGAYPLRVRGRSKVWIKASFDELVRSAACPGGANNAKIDWAIGVEERNALADGLIDRVRQRGGTESREFFRAAVALYVRTRPLLLDARREADIGEVIGTVGKDLDDSERAVLAALDRGDGVRAADLIDRCRQIYARTVAEAWFEEARNCNRAAARLSECRSEEGPAKRAADYNLVSFLAGARDNSSVGEFRRRLAAMVRKAEALQLEQETARPRAACELP